MKLGFPPSEWTKYFITCYHLFQYVNKIVIFLDKVPAFLVGSKKKQHLLVQKRRQNSCHFKFKANFTFYRSWMWKLIYRRSCSTKKKKGFKQTTTPYLEDFFLDFYIAALEGNSWIHQFSDQNCKNEEAVRHGVESYDLTSQTRQGDFLLWYLISGNNPNRLLQ